MSLMAIILWALHPLSPWRRYYESARYLLDVLIRNIEDQRTVDWLCAYPDDPRGISHIERAIDDRHAGIDLLIYIRARELLGEIRPLEAPQAVPAATPALTHLQRALRKAPRLRPSLLADRAAGNTPR
jgi:hypothetical protein